MQLSLWALMEPLGQALEQGFGLGTGHRLPPVQKPPAPRLNPGKSLANSQPLHMEWEGTRLDYLWVRQARRRGVGLVVRAGGLVEVKTALGTPLAQVESVLRQKWRWVTKHQARLAALPQPVAVPLVDGAVIPFRGQHLTLRLGRPPAGAGRRAACLWQGQLWLVPPAPKVSTHPAVNPTLSSIAHKNPVPALEAWLKSQAQALFEARVEHFAPVLGVRPRRVQAKTQRRRWGTCTSKGDVFLNWRLVLSPPEILDYVVVHELAHLLELNHSPRFWAHVARVLPDWQSHRTWLAQNGHLLEWKAEYTAS